MKSKQKTKVLNMRTLKLLCLVLIAIPGLIWPDNPHSLPEGHVRQADLSGPGPIPVDAFSLSTLADLKFTLNKYTGIKATVELAPENLGWTWGAQNFANCNQSGTAHFFRPVTGFVTANELFTQGIRGDVSTCGGEGPGPGGPSRYSVDLDGYAYYEYEVVPDESFVRAGESVPLNAKDKTRSEVDVSVQWSIEGCPESASLNVDADTFASAATFIASKAGKYTINTSAYEHEYSAYGGSAVVHVWLLEIVSLSPENILVLGNDLEVEYKIGSNFDTVELRILNYSEEIIYSRTDLELTEGTHFTTWEAGKWNQGTHSGAYANPKNGPYKVMLVATIGSTEFSESETLNTTLLLSAILEDNPAGTGTIATGLDDPLNNVKLTIDGPDANFNGQEFTPVFQDVVLEDLMLNGSNTEIRRVSMKYTSTELDSADDGEYTVRVVNVKDVAGNVAGDDRDPDNREWTVEIR